MQASSGGEVEPWTIHELQKEARDVHSIFEGPFAKPPNWAGGGGAYLPKGAFLRRRRGVRELLYFAPPLPVCVDKSGGRGYNEAGCRMCVYRERMLQISTTEQG